MRAVDWLYSNSRAWSSSDAIMSCCISAYTGTSWDPFFNINAVFNGEQEKESIISCDDGIGKVRPS